jgi:hypothetical protein
VQDDDLLKSYLLRSLQIRGAPQSLIADQWGYVTQTTQNCVSAATPATVIARPRIRTVGVDGIQEVSGGVVLRLGAARRKSLPQLLFPP